MEDRTSRQDFLERNDFSAKMQNWWMGLHDQQQALSTAQIPSILAASAGLLGLKHYADAITDFHVFQLCEFPTDPHHSPHLAKSLLLLQANLFIPLTDKNCLQVSSPGGSAHCGFAPLTRSSLLHYPHTQLLPCALLSSDLLEKKTEKSSNSWHSLFRANPVKQSRTRAPHSSTARVSNFLYKSRQYVFQALLALQPLLYLLHSAPAGGNQPQIIRKQMRVDGRL